jgi:hypothetical protein
VIEHEVTKAPTLLPDAVRLAVARVVGEPRELEELGGLSGSVVLRVRAVGGSVVAKGGVRAAEAEFYRAVAPLLGQIGVAVPALRWAGRVGGRRWLVLEDVPHPLPRERWGADAELLTVLVRLHGDETLPRLRARDAFRPAWPERLTALALSVLPEAEAVQAAPLLERMRLAASGIFAPRCAVSGDANPNNWGLRADGTLVLFDWERYCRGTPALDLAAALPGLGTLEEYDHLARGYVAAGGSDESGALRREIGLAKTCTAVELLAGVAEGQVADGPVAAWLRAALPGWVDSLAGMIL